MTQLANAQKQNPVDEEKHKEWLGKGGGRARSVLTKFESSMNLHMSLASVGGVHAREPKKSERGRGESRLFPRPLAARM